MSHALRSHSFWRAHRKPRVPTARSSRSHSSSSSSAWFRNSNANAYCSSSTSAFLTGRKGNCHSRTAYSKRSGSIRQSVKWRQNPGCGPWGSSTSRERGWFRRSRPMARPPWSIKRSCRRPQYARSRLCGNAPISWQWTSNWSTYRSARGLWSSQNLGRHQRAQLFHRSYSSRSIKRNLFTCYASRSSWRNYSS